MVIYASYITILNGVHCRHYRRLPDLAVFDAAMESLEAHHETFSPLALSNPEC